VSRLLATPAPGVDGGRGEDTCVCRAETRLGVPRFLTAEQKIFEPPMNADGRRWNTHHLIGVYLRSSAASNAPELDVL